MEQVTAFKGFDKNMQCRGYQFKVGETFTHNGDVEACKSGFHACEYPLDVFNYYNPASSLFAIVKASGTISREGSDSKIASATLTVEAEIGIPVMVSRAVDWIMSKIDSSVDIDGDRSAATNTGVRSAATNTGDQSAATNTGDQSAATNTGYRSAATNTGVRSAATNTGDRSAATVEKSGSVAIATGCQGKAKASHGSAIVLVYRNDEGEIVHIRASKVGENGIEPDVFYSLDENGEFVNVD